MKEGIKTVRKYIVVSAMVLVAVIGLPIIFPAYTKPDSEKSKKAESSLVLPS